MNNNLKFQLFWSRVSAALRLFVTVLLLIVISIGLERREEERGEKREEGEGRGDLRRRGGGK